MVENVRQKISDLIKNKNILLFGVTDETAKFYENYREVLSFKGCLTNYSANIRMQNMQKYGLETYLYDDFEITDEDFIIICDYEHYASIERRLLLDNYREYEKFVSSKLAIGILEEKKIALFMGSYSLRQIATFFNQHMQIKQQYLCQYYSEDELLHQYKDEMAEYKHLARICDVYISSVCDKDMYEAKVITEGFMVEKCIRIKVSDYMFNGYFPQIVGNRDSYSDFLYREKPRLNMSYGMLALAREDRNLAQYVSENVPVEEILERVCDMNYYTEEQVKIHYQRALDNVKVADQKADVKLACFLENKCSDMIAYRNLDEWNVEIVKYVIEKIAEKMGIVLGDVDEAMLHKQIDEVSGSELPVYPSVLKHLGITGWDNKKYKVVTFYKTRYMNFQEYIRWCVERMYQIKDMNIFLGIGRKTYDN